MVLSRSLHILVALSAACALACGDNEDGGTIAGIEGGCDRETRDDIYSINMVKAGPAGYEVVLVEADPAPPAKNDNAWDIQVLAPSGEPMDGMTLTVTPFMPDHGHGTPVVAEVVPEGSEGRYSIFPVNLWMPGLWRVRIAIADDSTTVDTVEYLFCIEG
jgi:hypothetical protein